MLSAYVLSLGISLESFGWKAFLHSANKYTSWPPIFYAMNDLPLSLFFTTKASVKSDAFLPYAQR